MRMTLGELADFAKLKDLKSLVPKGVKVDVYFHSAQREGPALEGPWYACALNCEGFATRTAAEDFWDAVGLRVQIGLNGLRPYNKVEGGNYWCVTIPIDRENLVRMKTV